MSDNKWGLDASRDLCTAVMLEFLCVISKNSASKLFLSSIEADVYDLSWDMKIDNYQHVRLAEKIETSYMHYN